MGRKTSSKFFNMMLWKIKPSRPQITQQASGLCGVVVVVAGEPADDGVVILQDGPCCASAAQRFWLMRQSLNIQVSWTFLVKGHILLSLWKHGCVRQVIPTVRSKEPCHNLYSDIKSRMPGPCTECRPKPSQHCSRCIGCWPLRGRSVRLIIFVSSSHAAPLQSKQQQSFSAQHNSA